MGSGSQPQFQIVNRKSRLTGGGDDKGKALAEKATFTEGKE
jgi:hypothetical protein